jgi:hypothetical protein
MVDLPGMPSSRARSLSCERLRSVSARPALPCRRAPFAPSRPRSRLTLAGSFEIVFFFRAAFWATFTLRRAAARWRFEGMRSSSFSGLSLPRSVIARTPVFARRECCVAHTRGHRAISCSTSYPPCGRPLLSELSCRQPCSPWLSDHRCATSCPRGSMRLWSSRWPQRVACSFLSSEDPRTACRSLRSVRDPLPWDSPLSTGSRMAGAHGCPAQAGIATTSLPVGRRL